MQALAETSALLLPQSECSISGKASPVRMEIFPLPGRGLKPVNVRKDEKDPMTSRQYNNEEIL